MEEFALNLFDIARGYINEIDLCSFPLAKEGVKVP